VIEAPSAIEEIQRIVLDAILSHIPAHDGHTVSARAFNHQFVAPHVGRPIVLKRTADFSFQSQPRVTAFSSPRISEPSLGF